MQTSCRKIPTHSFTWGNDPTVYIVSIGFTVVLFSIFINCANIDVNVHPTKREVHFLHEDAIIDCIQKSIQEYLLSCSSSRTYYTQSLLPSMCAQVSNISSLRQESIEEGKVYDYKLVRTDAKETKLDAFALPKSLTLESNVCDHSLDKRKQVHLTSILSLQSDIRRNRHNGIGSMGSLVWLWLFW